MKKSLFVLPFLCTSLFAQIYTVQPGETLSEILYKIGLKPLYGRKGMVEEIRRLNNLEKADHLKVGQKIRIEDVEFKSLEEVEPTTPSDPLDNTESNISDSSNYERVYRVDVELGSMSFVSKSPTGTLKLYGGSNVINFNTKTYNYGYINEFKFSADMIRLAKNIDFPISDKSIVLLQTEIATGYAFETSEVNLGLGLQDVMGTLGASNGVQLTSSRSPYLTAGFSQSLLGLNFELKGRYYLASEKGEYEIKSGSLVSIETSKSIYKAKSFKVNGFIKYQKQSIKTKLTDDQETTSLLGVGVEF